MISFKQNPLHGNPPQGAIVSHSVTVTGNSLPQEKPMLQVKPASVLSLCHFHSLVLIVSLEPLRSGLTLLPQDSLSNI